MEETILIGKEPERASGTEGSYLPLLPLKDVVLLPKSIIPIIVGRPFSVAAVEYALKHGNSLFVTAQKEPDVDEPAEGDVFAHGTRANILQVMRMPKGGLKILVEGICRAEMLQTQQEESFLQALCRDIPTTGLENRIELEALWRSLKELYTSYAKLNGKAPTELTSMVRTASDIDEIADTIAVHTNLSFDERLKILKMVNIKERILHLCTHLQREVEILRVEHSIRGRVQTQVEKNQREYYLNEQMKAIQKELGTTDQLAEVEQIRATLGELGMSTEAREKVEKELKRLEQMPSLSSEATVSRTYVEWLTNLPWNQKSKDRISLIQAERILDRGHAGLKQPKSHIIEFLAAKKFSSSLKRSPIICLVGPPGVGKTSLASSIAASLGRKFVRISLGGIRDEAEIRGHRRTYIGALPGKIVQAMRKAKTINPVILLDEVDKLANDIHGDPASALLEVLDPEQNCTFVDHFLDVEYDLSQVMFITTANMIDSIPYPLLDRMELIEIASYTEEEKFEIARRFLIPKTLKEHDLTKRQISISDLLIKKIINDYTKEAGVRNLERIISKILRKSIQVLLKDKKKKRVIFTEKLLKKWLGSEKFKQPPLDESKQIGLATGLAWTEVGGDLLEVEASVVQGKGVITLTGQLGEVMQESAQAAISYIRSRVKELQLKPQFHATRDIHIHLPEGATPKDGPSAGITMCAALVSALTKNPLKPKIAMTGEITLRGRVLAVGGLKEKLLAARRYGMTEVLVPKENKSDVEDLLEEVDPGVKITFVQNMDEILKATLTKNPFRRPMKRAAGKTMRRTSARRRAR